MSPSTIPELCPIKESNGLLLEEVNGATPHLFGWTPSNTSTAVQVPIYLDTQYDGRIEQVVICVHGKDRNAAQTWADVNAARARAQVYQGRVLVVSVQFFNGLDKDNFASWQGKENLLVWKGNGWGDGSTSLKPKERGVSSFEVLDKLLDYFSNRTIFPAIRRIVFSGHSLGGQLLQRYSILSPTQTREGMEVEYVIMNPASYLYFTADRSCVAAPNGNMYKYGFENIQQHLSSYFPIKDCCQPKECLQRFLERKVNFIQGEKDKGKGDESLEAMSQGENRLERARNYHSHLAEMERKIGWEKQRRRWTVDWVDGVGHDSGRMITSNAAIARILGPT